MNRTFAAKGSVKSEIHAISSKSEAHRYLICAALASEPCEIICNDTNADIDATAACLNALGAKITRTESGFFVHPIDCVSASPLLDCNESGSTLRFLLPLAAAQGADCGFIMRGRLASRPLSPLYELLSENGVTLSNKGSNPLWIKEKLRSGNYSLAANVSSQYISGMLFALAVSFGESELRLEGKIESAPYIEMTLDTLKAFGADIEYDIHKKSFHIKGREKLTSPRRITVGGDWSNAAFFLSAGAIGDRAVSLSGLDPNSRQGDRAVIDILKKMGAEIAFTHQFIKVSPSRLHGIAIDASDIPDLVPILAVVASVAEGETRICNASRLRLKESDRIQSVCAMLSALGADITPTDDGLLIKGSSSLIGGEVDSFNDHRIAMSAAIASLACQNPVTVRNFEAINKSYPSFPEAFEG